ncbi:Uncharacterized protein SCF082_LOCUS12802 [Durusdinium trenchii]|uniref:Uncharacterized protein n=1 Tax=Durusdinium trenchii TaxID=1381693 RepID=A0ABP0JM63_9DINO
MESSRIHLARYGWAVVMKVLVPLSVALSSFTLQESSALEPIIRKEPPHVPFNTGWNRAQVTVDAAANPEWNKSHRTLEAKQTPRTHGTVLSRSFYQLYLWKTTSSQISSNMMYLTLVVVILSGVALGVCIPIVVNYYYEEVNTPPWLRDLVEELSRRDSRREEEDIYARSRHESPQVRARRSRSTSSSRRRRRRREELAQAMPHGEILETSAGEADVSTCDDAENKAKLSFVKLPKVPVEHSETLSKQISSDEAGDSPSTEERLRVLRREWVQAVGTAARGAAEKRASEESTTAAEDSASSFSSSLKPRRGRSPEEVKEQGSSKRAVSFDSKVEVKNLEAETPTTRSPKLSRKDSSSSPKKDQGRRGQFRSRSPKV